MVVPNYLPYYVLSGSVAIIVAILFGLRAAVNRSNWSNDTQSRAIFISTVVLIGWFAAALGLALLGVYQGASDRIPTIQYGIFTPILIGGLLIWRSSSVAQVIDAVPQHWLVGVQVYRAVGVIFLILYADGKLPGLFAWPAGLGDVLVGVIAPIVAISFVRNPRQNGDLVNAWNWFGIFDLVVALTTGLVTSPSRLQLFAFDLPNELISAFPLVLIPTFLVPVSILLHVASLAKLHRVGSRLIDDAQTNLTKAKTAT